MIVRDLIKKILKEETNPQTYDYGCVMLYYDLPNWVELTNMINTEDIYDNDIGEFGIEENPHVTLLYGLHSEDIDDGDIMDHVLSFNQPEISMGGISLFNNDDFDVVKFDVSGDGLFEMNKSLVNKYPHTNDYPDYHPHSTIAYVKEGTGEKYVKNLTKPYTIKPNKVVYTKPDGSKIIRNYVK
jgi:2'-5' RNA ligase